MSWFGNLKAPKIKEKPTEKMVKIPEGLWVKCPGCGEILQSSALKENLDVCTECQYHFRMGAWERIALLTQDASAHEYHADLKSNDPLQFSDTKSYLDRLKQAEQKAKTPEALITVQSEIQGIPACIAAFEFKFMGGSMGTVVGEKLALLLEVALKERLPVIVVSSSGGARMQEGILSLMQMAKTSALIRQLRKKKLPYISILTDPTTGGVAASFAMQGDIIIAEPGALIGFAGPRVIEQTMKQTLPKGFQRSEFLLKHGFVDCIVHRKDLTNTVAYALKLLYSR